MAQTSLFPPDMRIAAVLCATFAFSSIAHADAPEAAHRYVGASASLASGYSGRGEFGFGIQVSPHPYLELEVGTLKHEVRGDDDAMIDSHDTWLESATVRAKKPLRHGALFVGLGVDVGEHAVANGCSSSGFIDFCGAANGTFVYHHYDRAVWLRPEFGGEMATGPVAARISIAPLIQMASPDQERGCLDCDDGEDGITFMMSVHGRMPL